MSIKYFFVHKLFFFLLIFTCFDTPSFSQDKFFIQNDKGTDKIKFKFINNLIIIPVEVNGVPLSFLLDTGVSKTILFNFFNVSDSLKIKKAKTIYLRGLGEGVSIETLKSTNNVIKIGDAIKLNQDLFAVYDENLNFSTKVGIPMHGIIGYDLLKDFVVEVNYAKKYLRLTEPRGYEYPKCNKCETLNLEFYNNKPYLNVNTTFNDVQIPVKLLIDSGSSDSLWLFEDRQLGLICSNTYFDDFLGHGLSGSIYGKRSKVDRLFLKSFSFNNVNVAYPESNSIAFAKKFKGRNGSLGGNILKRFNLIIDYRRAAITLKKNGDFKKSFSYNNSGLELEHSGMRLVKVRGNDKEAASSFGTNNISQNSTKVVLDTQYKLSLKPAFTIVEIRQGSPAEKSGLQIGDLVLSINGKSTYSYNLQQLMAQFYDDHGKRMKITVNRNGDILTCQFRLKDMFK